MKPFVFVTASESPQQSYKVTDLSACTMNGIIEPLVL